MFMYIFFTDALTHQAASTTSLHIALMSGRWHFILEVLNSSIYDQMLVVENLGMYCVRGSFIIAHDQTNDDIIGIALDTK